MQSPERIRQIYDISPLLSSELAVFPGDTLFERKVAMDFAQGDHLSLSSVTTTLHMGAHADAPSHYHKDGISIDECPLDTYFGDCQVVDVTNISGEITLTSLGPIEIRSARLLFKTNSIQDMNKWQDDFSYLSPQVIEFLASKKVKLIGIDTPSMDHSKSKTLECHQAFYRNHIAILEGLDLKKVPAGFYQLIALPLKIKGGEASPVRAILYS